MKKTLFIFTTILFFALALTSCKKDDANNNGNSNGNTENPGGGGSGGSTGGGNYNNQEYPSTANVIRRAVTDIDGNCYDAVQIGNQVWMAENLRTTKYADGTTIPLGTSTSTTTAYRYAPGSSSSIEENMVNVPRYGYLYNWPAVMDGASSSGSNPSGVQGICPNGWHVPSDAEWYQLFDYMRTRSIYWSSNASDRIAKALAATSDWAGSPEIDAPGHSLSTNNASGFSALPAGQCSEYDGANRHFGDRAFFWCSTEYYEAGAYDFRIYSYLEDPYSNMAKKCNGYSVRCVRD